MFARSASTVARGSLTNIARSHAAKTFQLKDASLLRAGGFINNKFVEQASSGETFKVYDPALGHEIGVFPDMGVKETEEAIQAAKKAQREWASRSAKERGNILKNWNRLILENEQDLAKILTWENGKPFSDALGEIRYGASFLEWFGEEAKRLYGEVIPSPNKNQRMMSIRQPLGVVGIITPWNFPNAMLTRKFGAALAVGCAVVVKPAAETPFSATALCELGLRAGVPEGILGIVPTHLNTKEIGQHLCESKDIAGISFTGSTNVGKILLKQSADTVKKMSLELGGNAAFIVFDDADLDVAVEAAVMGKFRSSGQTCVCVNRFYVQESVQEAFTKKLVDRVKKFNVGNGFGEKTTHGPLINDAAVEKVDGHVKDALSKGAQLMVGGTRRTEGAGDGGKEKDGSFYQPTVLTGMTEDMKMATEETFGPVAGIYTFKTEQEAIDRANSTPFGLASYFFSKDNARVIRVSEKLETGMVGCNTAAISFENIPFGGVKESGLGREGGRQGLEEYVETKYICIGGL